MNFITKSNPLLVLLFSLRLLSNLGNSKIRTKKKIITHMLVTTLLTAGDPLPCHSWWVTLDLTWLFG